MAVRSIAQSATAARLLVGQRSTRELFEMLNLIAGQSGDLSVKLVESWVRGALVDRDICPDHRKPLDPELILCEDCRS